MPEILLYKSIPCGYCSAAIRFLTEVKGLEIKIIDLTYKPEERIALMRKTGKRTVPQIFIGDVFVGGYDELRALDAKGGLDPLLQST